MRRMTSEYGGVPASLANRVRRLKAQITPRPHFFWLWPGETFDAKRDALIASGEANPNAHFTAFEFDHGDAPANPTGAE